MDIISHSEAVKSYYGLPEQAYSYLAHTATHHDCYKLCEVNGQIWCAGEDSITVISKAACLNIATIKHPPIKEIWGLAVRRDEVVVACHKTGLHRLDTMGQYQAHIAEGHFSDVYIHEEDYMYALDWKRCLVMVWKYECDDWEPFREVCLHYKECTWDRLSINADYIYVSTHQNSCIYVYSMEGKLVQIASMGGTTINICDVDTGGNFLVAEYYMQKLYVTRPQALGTKDDRLVKAPVNDKLGTWRNITLKDYCIYQPFHALLDSDGSLWVGTHTAEVVKYTPDIPHQTATA